MNYMKKLILTSLSIAAIVSFSACNKLDVIGDTSVESFEKVLEAAEVMEDVSFSWALIAPDGTTSFVWSMDYNKTQTYDIQLVTEAQPFLDAGLDTNLLPGEMLIGDKIVVGRDLGSDVLVYEGEVTPLTSYEQLVKLYRDSVKYHTAMDHFGIDLGNGNVFEWAKDMSKNDKDIVYALDPQVFIEAGVDPQKVEGWVFTKVQTMDEKGKKIEVDKFIKSFDLDSKQS